MSSAVLTMLPLTLIRVFGVSTSLPATTYAFAAAAGLTMYPAVTRISKQRGARSVLRAGFAIRAATAVLAVAFLSGIGGAPLARAGFVVLVLAWPLLGVSGTALTAQLAPGEKGEALGLFNACSSLAAAVRAHAQGLGCGKDFAERLRPDRHAAERKHEA